ncbi:hypothetical protein ADZ36_04540 [Streptomyces fradiae]|uniref:Uncharacterized protein n=1 Tax=Streptomyces fradiae TaxID=1906 RepID=A0ACC4WGN0_STRFR|nr:hypothetical protein ADZ36_04540 [Streptomyces fradiae]OFA53346.1 hypothetical protein BEN35_09480 [Streptomyces fradiae]
MKCGRRVVESGRASLQIVELDGERTAGAVLDRGVPRPLVRVHGDALAGAGRDEHVDERVGVARQMGQHMTAGPAGQPGRFGDGRVVQPADRGEQPFRGLADRREVARETGCHTPTLSSRDGGVVGIEPPWEAAGEAADERTEEAAIRQ